KLVASSRTGSLAEAAARAYRALSEFRIAGVPTNIPFLQGLLRHPDLLAANLDTGFVEDHAGDLLGADAVSHRRLFFEPSSSSGRVGARVDRDDPLAVLDHGRNAPPASGEDGGAMGRAYGPAGEMAAPENTGALVVPMQGTIV